MTPMSGVQSPDEVLKNVHDLANDRNAAPPGGANVTLESPIAARLFAQMPDSKPLHQDHRLASGSYEPDIACRVLRGTADAGVEPLAQSAVGVKPCPPETIRLEHVLDTVRGEPDSPLDDDRLANARRPGFQAIDRRPPESVAAAPAGASSLSANVPQ